MLYTSAMRSTDPRVLEAIPERNSQLSEGFKRANEWAATYGGDGIVGGTQYGTFRLAGITAASKPAGAWRRLPGPRTPPGITAYAPLRGSVQDKEMESYAIALLPVPGIPMWFEGRDRLGRKVLGTPSVFIHNGTAYCETGFEPDADQAPAFGEGDWEAVSLADAKGARAALDHAASQASKAV